MELLLASFESKLNHVQQTQKEEYRDFVSKLFKELEAWQSLQVKTTNQQGKNLISTAIRKLEKIPSSEILLMDPLGPLTADTKKEPLVENISENQKEAVASGEDHELTKKAKELSEMGFLLSECEAALQMCNLDLVSICFS